MDKFIPIDYEHRLHYQDNVMVMSNGSYILRILPKSAVYCLNIKDFRKMVKAINWLLIKDSEFLDACHILARWLQSEDPDLQITDRERISKLKVLQDVSRKRGLVYGSDRK